MQFVARLAFLVIATRRFATLESLDLKSRAARGEWAREFGDGRMRAMAPWSAWRGGWISARFVEADELLATVLLLHADHPPIAGVGIALDGIAAALRTRTREW